MSFPASGVEATYRNNIDEVARVLETLHSGHYIICTKLQFIIFSPLLAPTTNWSTSSPLELLLCSDNLSQRGYDYSKFDNRVEEWCGWPDHHVRPILPPPPLLAVHSLPLVTTSSSSLYDHATHEKLPATRREKRCGHPLLGMYTHTLTLIHVTV